MAQSNSWDGTFDVAPAEVTDAGRYVQLTAEELVNGLRSIDADVSKLLENWTGTSAITANEAFTKWVTGAQEVAEGIETMRTAATAARDRYQAAITTNLQMLGRSSGSQS
ncbi:WXG100 family type VII secretion target [Nocardia nepalensis]|uniref:WXG100 family type VII secretion target n=1 Tax=Nocardia nepalensis TaxID=3375448 RepID=UPI003B674F0C